MNRRSPTRFAVLVAGLSLVVAAGHARAQASWWQETIAPERAAAARVLGDLASWSIQNTRLQPGEYTSAIIGDRTVIAPGKLGLRLTSHTRYPAGTELAVRYRHAPAAKATASFKISAAVKDPADAKEKSIWFSSSVREGTDQISCHAWDPVRDQAGERRTSVVEYYRLNGIGDRSLGWPERLRQIAEHESTLLPRLAEAWMTVRIRLVERGFAVWVNDRLLIERQDLDLDTSGQVRLELSAGTELAAFAARPAPAADPLFEPIPIDGYLNAREFNRSAIDRGSLPSPGGRVLVAGVPFVFPAADARGNDHLDLGASWLQSGALEGHLDPARGPFGGRWPSPFWLNPARIQLQIPNRRYRAIHLIAAADGDSLSVPVVTAQFYRPRSGAPVNASTKIPLFTARSTPATPLPVRLANGRAGNLYHIAIPINPGDLALFDDLDAVAVELTKEVQLYRAYPDPSYYSYHAAGLPSSVHVFALTMETPAVLLRVEPDNYGHIWTAPEKPSYTLRLRNPTAAARRVQIDLRTTSYSGAERTEQTKTVNVPAGGKETVLKLPLTLKQHGYHDLWVTLTDGDQVWVEPLSLAFLAPDTRERGKWEPGRGTLFGFWCWGGGHGTPSFEKETLVTALAGAETYGGSYQSAPEPVKKLAEKYGMISQKYFGAGDHWITGALATDLTRTSEAAAVEKFVAALEKTITRPSPVTRPRYLSFFPEPHIGPHTSGSFPHHFGEPPAELSADEEQRYQRYLNALLVGGPVVRQRWPDCLILMPHGDPMFTALFARRSPEARPFIDGIAVDIPLFERLPEQQTHQVTLHRFWQCWQELRQAGITNLALPMYEGPCLPSRPGALTRQEFADHLTRSVLILNAYGVDQFPGAWGAFECSAAWGEQHYGGGVMHRLPLERPKPAYAAHATLSRQLNRENFRTWLPTGSLSVYALQYQHYQSGALTLVLWTIRGTRPVSVTVPPGTKATLYDLMDNATELQEKDGQLQFTIGSGPCFLQGLTNDVQITLGAPDHTDARPAPDALRLGNPGDRGWRQLEAADADYAESNPSQIRRFPGRMTLQSTDAPEHAGQTALAVHLEKQDRERLIMPYYTSVVPPRPITIPGKASHLGLWVRAASDWGRVVYCLRDAQGERWISVGTKGAWNADDTHNWSVFNFDGWRYLRFELPAHSPWDSFREAGTTWWGAYGRGDQIVDLPLRLEKIIIERRTHALYVNDPQPAAAADVLLGDLYAEYQRPADRGAEIVRLSRQRRPVPRGIPELGNPIADLDRDGVGPATTITRIVLPEQQADGTRCYVHFQPVDGARTYDVWASPYPDGQGALPLAQGWKEPGGLVRGLRPDTDFYLFVVYADQEGKSSKPSAAFKIRLQDLFAMK